MEKCRPRRNLANLALLMIAVASLLVAPMYIYPFFLMKVMNYALFACAFNLLLGYGGLISFGHAMFFGWASYICAYSIKAWGFPPELAILAGGGSAAVLGLITGYVAIRRQGIYFAMITLGLAQLMFFLAAKTPFTGGEDGIQGIPRGYLFGFIDLNNGTAMYLTVVAIFIAGFLLIYRIINSPFGEILKSIRENEAKATSLGYKPDHYKLSAFVISAAISGIAGGTNALVFQVASLTDVHWTMSGEVILIVLVGGVGTLLGPVAGALTIVAIQDYLSGYGEWVTVIQGLIFITAVLLFRKGIVGTIQSSLRIGR